MVDVKTGRKLTKFTCNFCSKVMICDSRKKDKKRAKFKKHLWEHKETREKLDEL